MKLRSTIVRSSSLIALTWACATSTALAHTDSLGFIITPGSGAGLYNAEIFYGSWHSGVSSPEGALDLSVASGSLVGTNPFSLVSGFNSVSNGTIPPGLVAGVNYFFPDGNGGLTGDSSGHDIYAFQSTFYSDLTPGAYTFGYNASSSFSNTWRPSDPAINDGAFTIGANGSLQVAGASGGAIDNSQTHFTSDNFSGGSPATFTGGTLQLVNGSTALSNNFTVDNNGGVIDSNYEDGVLSGDLDGAGVLTIAGPGSVEVTGANTHGGFLIDHGTLRAGSDSALGDPSAYLTIEHGVFAPTGSMSIARNVVITGSDGGEFDVDTGLTLTITGQVSGSSCLYKQGSGTMVLNAPGANAIGACVEDGLLAFNNTFTCNVWVDPTGHISGGGDIAGDVEVSGHIAPGNSPGVLTVAGDVTLLNGSTFDVDVDGATSGTGAGHHDQLILTNGGVFTANGALAPITRGISGSANNTYTPTIGDTYVIVDADGGVTGQFDAITQPASGLPGNARWDVFYTADEVILAVVADDFTRLSTLALGNARRLAGALDPIRSLPSGNTAEARALFQGLAGLDETQLAAVLQQTAGDIHADAMAATQRAARATRQASFDRLTQAHPSRRVWGQALGGRSAIDGDHEAESFDTRSGGLMVGADAPLTHQIVLGGAFEPDTQKPMQQTASPPSNSRSRRSLKDHRGSEYCAWLALRRHRSSEDRPKHHSCTNDLSRTASSCHLTAIFRFTRDLRPQHAAPSRPVQRQSLHQAAARPIRPGAALLQRAAPPGCSSRL